MTAPAIVLDLLPVYDHWALTPAEGACSEEVWGIMISRAEWDARKADNWWVFRIVTKEETRR
jgi:hypothetical protein